LNKLLPLIAFSVLLLIPIGAQNAFAATISTFDDKTAFLTATGATSATGPLPDLGEIPGGAAGTQVVGDATFSITPPSSQLFIGTSGVGMIDDNDWTLRLAGPDIAISDIENLDVDLVAPVFSFGINFVEPEFDPNVFAIFVESEFTITLKNGATTVDSFTVQRPNDVASFIGVWTDELFDRVEIHETTGGSGNEFFGEVFTGTTPNVQPSITDCTLTPDMVNLQLGPNEDIDIEKTIECDEPITGFVLDEDDCQLNDVTTTGVGLNFGVIVFNENILNLGDTSEEHCTAVFEITDENFDSTFWTQEIWINEPPVPPVPPKPPVVGGELIPIESTSLILVGAQSFSWMIPVVLSVLGIGLFVVSRKSE